MGCGTGGCSSGCNTGGCNKLNTFDWLAEMELPPHKQPFDIIEVRFKGTRKEFYRCNTPDIYINEHVVVEAENGYDIGKVSLKGELVKIQLKKYNRSETDGDFRKVIRRANEADTARLKENQEMEVPTMYKARSIAMELGLSMKLSDVEYQGDRRKATFYYTAEERVDFRELIKRLAESFKVRIEMRQIGYRQEAGRLGAIGSCGRELCCSTWLTDFKLVNNNAARYQNLSLNPLKLSGQCGKLKCCLNFELDSYLEALKEFPDENTVSLQFEEDKTYKSVKTDILKRLMWFAPQTELGGDWISLPVKQVKEYIYQNKNGEKPALVIQEKKQVKIELNELEFKNDMGIGSLTRLDDRDRKKKNNDRNRNKNKNRQNTKPAENHPRQESQGKPTENQGNKPNNRPPHNGPKPDNRPRNQGGEGQNPNANRPGKKPNHHRNNGPQKPRP